MHPDTHRKTRGNADSCRSMRGCKRDSRPGCGGRGVHEAGIARAGSLLLPMVAIDAHVSTLGRAQAAACGTIFQHVLGTARALALPRPVRTRNVEVAADVRAHSAGEWASRSDVLGILAGALAVGAPCGARSVTVVANPRGRRCADEGDEGGEAHWSVVLLFTAISKSDG